MKQPPTIQPAERHGPAYDPMDKLVQDLQNIQSFMARLEDKPKDLKYLKEHHNQILNLRKGMLQQIELLNQDPYNYSHAKLTLLKAELGKIFSELEGIVGAVDPWNKDHFQKFVDAIEKAMNKFDDELTP